MAGWAITYMGDGVTAVEGVGVFQRWTTAYVSEDVASSLRGDARWTVTGPDGATSPAKAPPPPAPEPVAAAVAPAEAPAPGKPEKGDKPEKPDKADKAEKADKKGEKADKK